MTPGYCSAAEKFPLWWGLRWGRIDRLPSSPVVAVLVSVAIPPTTTVDHGGNFYALTAAPPTIRRLHPSKSADSVKFSTPSTDLSPATRPA